MQFVFLRAFKSLLNRQMFFHLHFHIFFWSYEHSNHYRNHMIMSYHCDHLALHFCSRRSLGFSSRSTYHPTLGKHPPVRAENSADYLSITGLSLPTSIFPHPAQVQLFCNYASWWTPKSLTVTERPNSTVQSEHTSLKISSVLLLWKDILMCWHHRRFTAKQIGEVMRLFCFLEPNFVWDGMIGCHIRRHYWRTGGSGEVGGEGGGINVIQSSEDIIETWHAVSHGRVSCV